MQASAISWDDWCAVPSVGVCFWSLGRSAYDQVRTLLSRGSGTWTGAGCGTGVGSLAASHHHRRCVVSETKKTLKTAHAQGNNASSSRLWVSAWSLTKSRPTGGVRDGWLENSGSLTRSGAPPSGQTYPHLGMGLNPDSLQHRTVPVVKLCC